MSFDSIVERPAERVAASGPPNRTIVVGLGNPILGDDGVGWRVAEAVGALHPEVEVECLALGGLSLMERLVGYQRAIVIDALQTPNGRPGQVLCLPLEDLPDRSSGHTTSAHDTSLRTALRLGQAMGADLPVEVIVVGVVVAPGYDFSEALSEPVDAAVPAAARLVAALLGRTAALVAPCHPREE
jgi:hydrogenase maturation protease